MIDGIHEADLARGGVGYLDPKEGRIATQHGFRSTFRSGISTGNHADERAMLMQPWAVFCNEPVFQVPTICVSVEQAA